MNNYFDFIHDILLSLKNNPDYNNIYKEYNKQHESRLLYFRLVKFWLKSPKLLSFVIKPFVNIFYNITKNRIVSFYTYLEKATKRDGLADECIWRERDMWSSIICKYMKLH